MAGLSAESRRCARRKPGRLLRPQLPASPQPGPGRAGSRGNSFFIERHHLRVGERVRRRRVCDGGETITLEMSQRAVRLRCHARLPKLSGPAPTRYRSTQPLLSAMWPASTADLPKRCPHGIDDRAVVWLAKDCRASDEGVGASCRGGCNVVDLDAAVDF